MSHRFKHLDGLRGIAAAIVLLGHSIIAFDFAIYSGDPTNSVASWDVWLSGAPLLLPVGGNLSVCLFFALSGFVLIGAFDGSRIGVIPLLVKRYLRLAIPIMCVCLLSYLMLRTDLMANHQVAAISRSSWLDVQFAQHPSFLAALREGGGALIHRFSATYDSSLWTMPIEFVGSVCILLFCFVAKNVAESPNKRRIVYILFSGLLLIVFSRSYLGLFGAGALIRLLMADGWEPLNRSPKLATAICAIGVFLGTIPASAAAWPMFRILPALNAPEWMPWPVFGAFFWHAVGAVLILVALQSMRPLQVALMCRPIQWLGKISFPLYLIMIPILMSLGCRTFLAAYSAGIPYGLSATIAGILVCAASLLSAHVLAHTVEPFALWFSDRVARNLVLHRWRRAPA